MFNILNFIDSKAVREYNKDTKFTPLEQAIIIYYSRCTSVDEKISAWRELLDTYSEDDFKSTRYGEKVLKEISNKQVIADTIETYEKALEFRNKNEGVVFETAFSEVNCPDSVYRSYFSDYKQAYEHIKKEKQDYLDDKDLKDVVIEAQIGVRLLNSESRYDECTFYFNNDLKLCELYYVDDNDDYYYDLSYFFIYVPLPFKKGDILRSIITGKIEYGVAPDNFDEDYYSISFKNGDGSDIQATLDYFIDDKFYYDHYNYFYLEKCENDNDIPKNQKNILLLRDVYKGKLEFRDVLFVLTRYGKDAYKEFYRDM